jgi:hypothetical protein
VTEAVRVPAAGDEHTVPAPDPIARDYLLLALRLDQHIPGLVDSYFGPRDLKAQVDMERLASPARLAADAAGLRARVASEVVEPDRRRWLERQLVALETHATRLVGPTVPYVEEVTRYLDARPDRLPSAEYADVRHDLDALLPGRGSLVERLAAWETRYVVPADRVRPVVDLLLLVIRRASLSWFPVPEGETLRVSLVRGQPWSGYNWYDGGLRSRVDLNVDLPIRPLTLLDTLTHETYPGHHLEHAWKEQRLVQQLGRVEAAVQLINAPECFVSEGLAELGGGLTLDPEIRAGALREACLAAGLPAGDDEVALQLAVRTSLRRLRGSGGDAALMLHDEGRSPDEVGAFLRDDALMLPEVAAKRLAFITHPLWRTYVFCYAGGEVLLRDWCGQDESAAEAPDDAAPSPRPNAQRPGPRSRFFRLLTEQLTPSGIAAELGRASVA